MSLMNVDHLETMESKSAKPKDVSKTFSIEVLDPRLLWISVGLVQAKLSCRAAQKAARRCFETLHVSTDVRIQVRTTDGSSGKQSVYDVFYVRPGASREAYDMTRMAKTHKLRRDQWPKAPIADVSSEPIVDE